MRDKAVHLLRVATVLGALSAAVIVVASAGTRLEHPPQPHAASGPIYLPHAQFLRPVSLGYQAVLADVLWFRTISYFGEHYRSDRTYAWLAYMCDLVTDLNPRADYVYRFAGMILPWEANQVDEGIRLLNKGVGVFPDSWLLHFWLGFTYYFFKSDYDRASQHMGRAAALPGAHPIAAHLASLLYQHQYGPETTLQFLADMSEHADNQQMREVAQRQMREARLAADLQRLATAVAGYRARFGHPPASVAALVAANLLTDVPNDPFGGVYEIDPASGSVRSSTRHQPSRLYRSVTAEAAQRGESVRE
jgi:tetratricopeptide (TPR) repeat protein